MHKKLIGVLAAAILTAGLATAAFAQSNAPAAPQQQPRSPMQGQGMMGGGGMIGGGSNMMGMMGMMSAMTRMANTCNRMMESATKVPASPAGTTSNPSHG